MTSPKLISITTPSGRQASAYVAISDSASADMSVPGMLLFHAFQGLKQEFIDFAATYAAKGYLAVAVDLYGGETTDDFTRAYELMDAMDEAVCNEIAVAWADWLRSHEACSGKVGTVGWCLGGTWSLNTSLVTPVEATVVYYGSVAKTAGQLSALKGPVLGHFGTTDEYFGKDMVEAFEREMAEAGKPFTNHWYDAGHAFANTGGDHFHAPSAALADDRTWDFLDQHLS